MAHTPPGGYGASFPPLVMPGCTEPLVEGAPDLRGTWRVVSATRGGKPVAPDDRILSYTERIEQAGNRIVDCGGGTIADCRADGTEENGVHDVSVFDYVTPIHVIATYENGVFVLRPVGIPGIEVTRRLDANGHMVWTRPDLGGMVAVLERVKDIGMSDQNSSMDTVVPSARRYSSWTMFMVSLHRLSTIIEAQIENHGATLTEMRHDLDPMLCLSVKGSTSLSNLLAECGEAGTTLDSLRRLEMLGFITSGTGRRIADPADSVMVTPSGRDCAQSTSTAILQGLSEGHAYLATAAASLDTLVTSTERPASAVDSTAVLRGFCRLGHKLIGSSITTPFSTKYNFTVLASMCLTANNGHISWNELTDFTGYPTQRVEKVVFWLQDQGLVHIDGMTGHLTEAGHDMLRSYFMSKETFLGDMHSLLHGALQLAAFEG